MFRWTLYFLLYFCQIASSYLNFNELKLDMEYRVSRLSTALQKIYEKRCQIKNFQCPVKSFNICQGTGQRQCLNSFPTANVCDGSSRFSLASGIRIPNSFASFNLSQQMKYFFCKTAQPQFQNVLQNLIDQNQKRYAWAAFGSNTGGHRVSPGFKYGKQLPTQSCKNYDPRLRPWFASNVYRQKKMIILVQNSRPIHSTPNRYPSIQTSLQALLKTSKNADLFNIIQFSDTARPLFSTQSLELVNLGQQIKKYNTFTNTQDRFFFSTVNNISKSISPASDYTKALQLAVQILQNSKNSNIQLETFILIFAGFKPINYDRNLSNKIISYLQNKQKQLGLNFIIFSFGVNMIDSQGIKLLNQLSCNFDGIYIPIQQVKYESLFLDQAIGYYQYLIQNNKVQDFRWTDIYQDAFGLGKMVSVVRPTYYTQNNVTRLIGVGGVDVLIDQLLRYKNLEDIKKQLAVTDIPFKLNVSLCALETIRRNHKCYAPDVVKCANYEFCKPTIFPASSGVIRSPIDTSDSNCCTFQQSSNLSIILGLSIGLSFGLIIIVILVYLLIFRRNKKQKYQQTYKQIFNKFKDDFDHTRIRSDSQISLIKQ